MIVLVVWAIFHHYAHTLNFRIKWHVFSDPILMGLIDEPITKGVRFLFKEGNMYYKATKERYLHTHLTVRCVHLKQKGCKFRAQLYFKNVSDCNLPEFFHLSNFMVRNSIGNFTPHSCSKGMTEPPPTLDTQASYTRYHDKFFGTRYVSQE